MQRQLLNDRIGIELSGSGAIQEGQEDARLLRKNPDGFEGSKVDEVEKLVNGGCSGEIPNVNGAASSGVGGTESNLEGSGRILWLFFNRKSDHNTLEWSI